MAENVKIHINTQEIIAKLHSKAMEEIKGSEYTIFNSLIEFDQGDSKENPQIMVVKKDNSQIQEEEKTKCVDTLKTYVKYFVGENFSEQIKEENLNELTKEDTEGKEDDSSNNQEQNPQSQEQDGEDIKESTGTGNIFISLLDRKVEHDVGILFEATPPTSSKFKTVAKTAWRNTKSFLFGYGIFYKFWRGKTPWTMLKNAASTANRSLFAGVLADLANMKIQTSSGDINVGHMIAKGIRSFQRTRINVNDIDNHLINILKNDFPQTDAKARVYDTTSLRNSLEDQGKWKPEYEEPFKSAKYAATIQVGTRDKAYKQFNQEKMAEIFTRAFGDALKFRPFRGNRVGPQHVIKIEDYQSEYRNHSRYDRRTSSRDTGDASSLSENQNIFYQKNVKCMLDILFEARRLRPGEVEATFFVKNPLITNPVRNKISTLVGPEGSVLSSPDAVEIPNLSTYELSGFEFQGWQPDPNDFHPKPGENKHIDTYAKIERPRDEEHYDLYIVPHPMIDSYNRKDDYEVSNDGTVTSKMSNKDFKREDFTR